MAGRSRSGIAVALPETRVLLAVVGAGIALGVVLALVLGGGASDAGAADSSAAADPACDDGRTLRVAAGADIAPTLTRAAAQFGQAVRAAGRACVDVTVATVEPRDATVRLAQGWDAGVHGPAPHVWMPDSTAWLQIARSQADDSATLPADAPVIARSPIVVAMPQPMAGALNSTLVKWRDLLELADDEEGWARRRHPEWGAFGFVVADPLRTTSGMLTLLSFGIAQDEIWAGGPSGEAAITIDSDLGVLRFRRVVTGVADDVGVQLRRYVDAADPLTVMSALPLTERQLWRFNRGELPLSPSTDADGDAEPAATGSPPPVPLQAVYPTEGAVAADYPFVTLRGPWVDGAASTAAAEFAEFLASDAGQAVFLEDGFRGPRNSPNPNFTSDGGLTPSLGGDYAPVPASEVTQRVRTSWRNVTRPSATLLAVDVSGSMLRQVEAGGTRLDATIEAAVRALDLLPVTSDVGLWEFSTDLEGGRNDGDHRELVALGPLDGQADGQRRSQALVDALQNLEPRNDTALNDTALAAFRHVQEQYAEERRHTVVLLTDGRNDDPGSIGHERLLERLAGSVDDDRPVRVVAIAYGDEPDVAKLQEITDVTGGKVLVSPRAEDLDALFLEALSGS